MNESESKVQWKIYYDDGSTYSNLDGPPEQAPARGVEVIAQYDRLVGRHIVQGRDFYVFQGGVWYSIDLFGLFDWVMDHGVKCGRTIGIKEFREIMNRAANDPDLPRKTCYYVQERQP